MESKQLVGSCFTKEWFRLLITNSEILLTKDWSQRKIYSNPHTEIPRFHHRIHLTMTWSSIELNQRQISEDQFQQQNFDSILLEKMNLKNFQSSKDLFDGTQLSITHLWTSSNLEIKPWNQKFKDEFNLQKSSLTFMTNIYGKRSRSKDKLQRRFDSHYHLIKAKKVKSWKSYFIDDCIFKSKI